MNVLMLMKRWLPALAVTAFPAAAWAAETVCSCCECCGNCCLEAGSPVPIPRMDDGSLTELQGLMGRLADGDRSVFPRVFEMLWPVLRDLTRRHLPHEVEIVQDAENAGANAFSPPDVILSLGSGDTITWFNADLSGSYGGGPGTTHHLTSDDGTTFDSGIIPPLGLFQATFSAPGTYNYRCEIHSSMRGTVTVNP